MTEETSASSSEMDVTAKGDSDTSPMIPKQRLDQEVEKRRAVEAELEALATEAVQEVPEQFRALIPNVSASEKLKWLKQAKGAGLFKTPVVAETDSKPPTTTPKDRDISNLPPHLKIAAGYGTKR